MHAINRFGTLKERC